MNKYIIRGSYKAGILGNEWRTFTKEIVSQNEKNARDKAYSMMGSEHGLKRNSIVIDEVTPSE